MKNNELASRGFTILELITAVAIVALMAAIAIPSMSDFVEKQAVKSDVTRMAKVFTSARSQAMTSQTGFSSVCWNGSGVAVAPDNSNGPTAARVPPRSMAVFEGGPESDGNYGNMVSVLDIDPDRLFYNTDDNDNCLGFDAQGRLIQSNLNGTSFVVCKAENTDDDAYRIDISIGGRNAVRSNAAVVGAFAALNCS